MEDFGFPRKKLQTLYAQNLPKKGVQHAKPYKTPMSLPVHVAL